MLYFLDRDTGTEYTPLHGGMRTPGFRNGRLVSINGRKVSFSRPAKRRA